MSASRKALLLVILLGTKAPAFDFGTGLGPGLGGAVVLSQSSASTLLSVPGGVLNGQTKLEMCASRRFEMKDLDQLYFAAAWRHKTVTAALGLSQFGSRDLYAERTARLFLAVQLKSVSFGAGLSGMMVETGGGYDRLTATALNLGVAMPISNLRVAIAADNLNSPSFTDNSPSINPKYSVYAEYVTSRSFSTVGRITLEKTEKPQLGLGQLLHLSSTAILLWGFSTAPILYGGGLELALKKGRLSYTTSIHPVLGFTHQVSLAYTFGASASEKEKVF